MPGMRRRVFDPSQPDGKPAVTAGAGSGDRDTDRSVLTMLQRRVDLLERELQLVSQQAPAPSQGSPDAAPLNRDARWHCSKCGYLLGFYDLKEDVLRTRYKEHIVFVRCGDGGFVQVVCRGCSEVNTAHGTTALDPAG